MAYGIIANSTLPANAPNIGARDEFRVRSRLRSHHGRMTRVPALPGIDGRNTLAVAGLLYATNPYRVNRMQGPYILQAMLSPCSFALPMTLPPCRHPSPIFTIVNSASDLSRHIHTGYSNAQLPTHHVQAPFPQFLSPVRQTADITTKTLHPAPIYPHVSPSIPTQMNGNERK